MAQDVEFDRKKAAALAAFQAKTAETEWQYLEQWPWLLRAQWALGLRTKPMYFNSLCGEALQGCFRFGVLLLAAFFSAMRGATWSSIGFLLFFVCFCFIYALCIRAYARKKQLPSWESL
ncbi:DUF6404 family protein [Chitinibacter sp. SCUT-21]|uniref:DUF6404 family protein n=1 Tax=Chitinibacter sp. SCUT-21 TaxID=2970891 RepID=UPI0035A7030C